MTSLGETLRRARLKRNLELKRIADELKISATMLKAIEEERFDKLPGGVFARSFVRQYARYLELNEAEILGELQRMLEPAAPEPLPHAPQVRVPDIPLPRMAGWQALRDATPRWSSLVWAGGLVVLAVLASAGAYNLLQRERHPVAKGTKNPVVARPAAPVQPPAVVQTPSTPPPSTVSAPPPAPATQPPPTPAPNHVPGPEEAAAAAEEAGAGAAVPNNKEPLTSPENGLAPLPEVNPDAPVRVEVIAEESSWVSLSSDGKTLFSGVLNANQSRAVGANDHVMLKIGNAGGVNVLLNGRPIGPVGPKGVVRTLQLNSGGFKIVPPEAPKPGSPALDPL